MKIAEMGLKPSDGALLAPGKSVLADHRYIYYIGLETAPEVRPAKY